MKKRFLIFISMLFFIPGVVNAASANVSISAPSSVYVGDTVTVNVTISSSTKIGAWEYYISYDDSKLTYSSTTAESVQHVINSSDSGRTSVNYSWTFTASNTGSASFSISGVDAYAFDDDSQFSFGGSTSTSINIVKPSSGGNGGGGSTPTTQYNYSDDNNLSSLNIEGFEIDFESSITEYSITVPNDTNKVKIGATASDDNASVSGIGEYDVKEGSNEIEIVVTAENGDKKTYKINVVVKELAPIEIELDGKKYSVVRKNDKLPSVNSTYKLSTILIKGESVPCYHSDITDIYLIGLMNDKGDIVLYQYDSSKDKFNIYDEINISGLYISLINTDAVPSGYKKGKIKIGEKEFDGFLKDGSYSLLYGINLETGEKNFYSYDSSESTLQKFLNVKTDNKYNSYIISGLIGLCIFEFIMIIVSIVSKNKQLKKVLRSKLDTRTEYEKSIDSVSDESYNDEDNITDDPTDEYLSSNDELEKDVLLNNEIDEASVEDASYKESELSESTDSFNENVSESVQDEDDEDNLGHTALISKDLNNVFDNSINRKEKKRKKRSRDNDDEMFKF